MKNGLIRIDVPRNSKERYFIIQNKIFLSEKPPNLIGEFDG